MGGTQLLKLPQGLVLLELPQGLPLPEMPQGLPFLEQSKGLPLPEQPQGLPLLDPPRGLLLLDLGVVRELSHEVGGEHAHPAVDPAQPPPVLDLTHEFENLAHL